MAKIERFFHLRPDMNNGGATVRVIGDTDHVGQVDVQVAFCHTHTKGDQDKGDPYCRKTGRETAAKHPVKVVPLRYLPKELERIYAETHRRSYGYIGQFAGAFDFSVKYFLPKE